MCIIFIENIHTRKLNGSLIEHFVGEKVPGDSTSNRAEGLKVNDTFYYIRVS